MKNALKYSKLWQQKRDELKVDNNPDMDWSGMNDLLNKHLPLTPNVTPSSGSSGTPGGAAGASGLAKLGGIIGISTTVVAVTIYIASHFAGINNSKKHRDSLARHSAEQKILADTAGVIKDILSEQYQGIADSARPIALQDSTGKGHGATDHNVDEQAPRSVSGTGPIQATPLSGPTVAIAKNNVTSKNDALKAFSGTRSGGLANLSVRRINSGKIGPGNVIRGNERSRQGNIDRNSNGRMSKGNKHPDQIPKNNHLSNSAKHDRSAADTLVNNVNDALLFNSWSKRYLQKPYMAKLTDPTYTIPKPGGDRRSILVTNIRSIADKLKPNKVKKQRARGTGILDWGILAGINTSNSFTRSVIDSNMNTSVKVDLYGGLYGTYYFKPKWGISAQLWLFNPQKISGSYSHFNDSKVDSGKLIQVTDTRKAYFATLPVQVLYKVNNNFNVKLGPVINIPVKQINGSTKLTPTTISRDTVYFRNATAQLNQTRLYQKIIFGLSAGLQYQYGRFSVEANYLKNLSGYHVTSGYGSYRMSDPGSFQVTVGFRLNKDK